MTDFQIKFIQSLRDFLSNERVPEHTLHRRGKNRSYYFVNMRRRGHIAHIYIYDRDAMFTLDLEDPRIFERYDYDTPEQLTETFFKTLKDATELTRPSLMERGLRGWRKL